MKATPDTETLFVYGSLQRGQDGHHLLQEATFLGEARTAPQYTLLWDGSYPALSQTGVDSIEGELYCLSKALLARLDTYEEAPDVYFRDEVEMSDGTRYTTYFATPETFIPWQKLNGRSWKDFLLRHAGKDI